MTSIATRNRLLLASEIQRQGTISDISCDRCFLSGHCCIAMEVGGRMKCAECVRIGRPCVNLSWDCLDRTREECRKKIDEDEEELSRVLARLMRNKKIIRQADERAKRKAQCLAAELEAAGELEVPEDCPAADACVGLSPAVWGSLDLVNMYTDFSVPAVPAEASPA